MGPIEYDPYADKEDSASVEACENVAEKLSEMDTDFAVWLDGNLQHVHTIWKDIFYAGMKHKEFLIAEVKANGMSEKEPGGPYVYQPYGIHDCWGIERLWGVSGVNAGTTIKGLTKEEAHIVADALKILMNTKNTQKHTR